MRAKPSSLSVMASDRQWWTLGQISQR